jgi:hypothetical protein
MTPKAGQGYRSPSLDLRAAVFLFLNERFSLQNEIDITPIKIPIIMESSMITARDDSNFQERTATAMGAAFCTEKMTMTATTAMTKINVIMLSPPLCSS